MNTVAKDMRILGMSFLLVGLLISCRGDDQYNKVDAGDSGKGCEHICVADQSECVYPGLLVEGWCPNDGRCCDPEGQAVDTGTGAGNDTGTGAEQDTYEHGPCQYQCLDFMSCPLGSLVTQQECEDSGQVCCNLEV